MSLSVEDVAGELRALSACGSVDHFAEMSLLLLWDLIPCDGVGFNDIDEARRRIEFFRSTDPDDASAESEEEFWSYADELPICWGLPPGECRRRADRGRDLATRPPILTHLRGRPASVWI